MAGESQCSLCGCFYNCLYPAESGCAENKKREEKVTVTHEPNMNITNQINAGLNGLRKGLIDYSLYDYPRKQDKRLAKAMYILNEIANMIAEHKEGRSIPWSERKYKVLEEFGE